MGKPFEVKEFDSIISNADYKDDKNYKYLNKKEFENLIAFIHEFSGTEETSDALEFMRIGYKRNIGDVVTIKNYVGLIQMKNGFQIQVLPKISFDDEDNSNEKTKRVFLKMLRSMKDFPSKVFNESSLKVDQMNLYELFINMYLQEVRQLVKKGIKSNYVEQQDNLRFFKGKLLVSEHIKANMIHKERFYVSFDEFHPNRAENRLVKATLNKLQKLTTSAENSKEIRQLLTAFEMVDASVNYQKDFSQVVINRNTKDYEMLMQWSKVFLMDKSFTTFSGDTTSRALLFPMESVYEAYVAKEMKKVFGADGWDVSSQDKGHYLFTSPRKQFALRPDIVMRKDDRTIILDTKWKRLVDNDRINYGISQPDMYQMYAYSKKYHTPEIWLLYPITEEMKNHAPIDFDSGDNTKVHVFFVDVEKIEDSLEELKSRLMDGADMFDYRFVMTKDKEILTFSPDFQKEVYKKYLEQNNLDEENVLDAFQDWDELEEDPTPLPDKYTGNIYDELMLIYKDLSHIGVFTDIDVVFEDISGMSHASIWNGDDFVDVPWETDRIISEQGYKLDEVIIDGKRCIAVK